MNTSIDGFYPSAKPLFTSGCLPVKKTGNILVTRNSVKARLFYAYKRANKIVIADIYPTLNGSQAAKL